MRFYQACLRKNEDVHRGSHDGSQKVVLSFAYRSFRCREPRPDVCGSDENETLLLNDFKRLLKEARQQKGGRSVLMGGGNQPQLGS